MRDSKLFKAVSLAVLVSFASGCASSTIINSNPSGASVYLNGEKVGTTPYTMTDNKIIGTTTTVRLTKAGCEDFNTVISRSEEFDAAPVILGFCLGIWPWLWAMKYKPSRSYDLECR